MNKLITAAIISLAFALPASAVDQHSHDTQADDAGAMKSGDMMASMSQE